MNGKEADFSDYSFQMRLAVKSTCVKAYNIMDRYARCKEEVTLEDLEIEEVLNPVKAKDAQELAGMLERWELKVGLLEKECREVLSQKIKAAVLLGMCM